MVRWITASLWSMAMLRSLLQSSMVPISRLTAGFLKKCSIKTAASSSSFIFVLTIFLSLTNGTTITGWRHVTTYHNNSASLPIIRDTRKLHCSDSKILYGIATVFEVRFHGSYFNIYQSAYMAFNTSFHLNDGLPHERGVFAHGSTIDDEDYA